MEDPVDRRTMDRVWIAMIGVVGLATALRATALGWPADAEELALVGPFSPSEWATNPPLLSWIVNALAARESVVTLGRAVSTVAAAAAILGVGATARAAGASRVGATLAAVALAVLPAFVQQAALYRAYAPAAALLAWHLYALVRTGEGSARAGVVWALTAALLPWLHYATAPGLVLELLLVGACVPARTRGLAALALGAALAGIGLGVLGSGSHPPVDDDPDRLWGMLRLGFSGTLTDAPRAQALGVAAVVLVAAVLGVAGGGLGRRALARGVTAIVAGVAIVAFVARAREPVQIFWVLPCLTLAAAPVAGWGWTGLARAAVVTLALASLGATPRPSRYQEATDALWRLPVDGEAVALFPNALWDMWLFESTGAVPIGPSNTWTCPGGPPGVACFTAAGRRWTRATAGLPEAGRWLAVAIDAPEPPARCGPAEPVAGSTLWRTATCPAP